MIELTISKIYRLARPEINEQQAIASILSDMDKEIADLEARRDKYTQIKSGMMQKLLTGQIRLIQKQQARIIPLDVHIVAGHIVNKLHESRGWGRTKLQKSLHLIGYHCQLDFGNEYIRNTAGPDDQKLMNYGEFYQFNLSSCIRQQNSLTAQFVSFSLSNLANIFYPPPIFTIINLCLL